MAESSFFVPVEDVFAAFFEVFDELLFLFVGGGFDVDVEFGEEEGDEFWPWGHLVGEVDFAEGG